MFDISFFEFFLAAVVALVVLGPQRLPGALRTAGLWIGRLRRSYYNVKTEIEREIGMDDVRRQLHNEQVMADVRRVEREVRDMGAAATEDMALTNPPATASPPAATEGAAENRAPEPPAPSAGAAPSAGEAAERSGGSA